MRTPRFSAIAPVSREASMTPPLRRGRWSEWACETKLTAPGPAALGSMSMRLPALVHEMPLPVIATVQRPTAAGATDLI